MDNGLGVALPFPLPVTAMLGVDDGKQMIILNIVIISTYSNM